MIRILNIVLLTVLAGIGIWWMFEDELTPADRKILFVGNSYIFGGDVPGMVEAMAASADPSVRYHTRMIAKPDYRLHQHVAEGTAQAELASGVWDHVVIQEKSTAAFSARMRDRMTASLQTLGTAAKAEQVQVHLYAHWPPSTIAPGDRDRAVTVIEEVYSVGASDIDGSLIRIGAVWRTAWQADITGLYADDGHHASTLGAYAAALAVLDALGDVDPKDVTWVPPGLDPDIALRIRDIASANLSD